MLLVVQQSAAARVGDDGLQPGAGVWAEAWPSSDNHGLRPGEAPRESFDVRFWKIRSYKGKRGQTHAVRWTVAGEEHHQTYKTRALANSRLAELRTYAREGVAFDVVTGLPVPEVRKAKAEPTAEGQLSWYQHTLNYVARRREGLSGNSLRSIAETLASVTPVLLVPGEGRPDDELLREALYG